MDAIQHRLSFGELFSGPGGLGFGLQEAGFTPFWAVDNDPWACETYRANVGPHVLCRRVEEVDFLSLSRPSGLAFGFPCNDFSQVGEKLGTSGYYGNLYRQAVRAIEEVTPEWFIAENVPGLLQNGGRNVMGAFADAGPGYLLSVHLYRFEEYGVPQRRHRVIGVGIREDLQLTFSPPAPPCVNPVSVGVALKGVEAITLNNEHTRHPRRVVERLQHIPEGSNAWDSSLPEHLRLNVEGCRLSVIYRRLHRDQPAYTVTGSGGGGTHMYHYAEPRALTNRERARLQSFPDDFFFHGPKEAVRRQIGMAVPPLAAQRIGDALRHTLTGRRYPSIDPSVGVLRSESLASSQQLELPVSRRE